MSAAPQAIQIDVEDGIRVSGIVRHPPDAKACVVVAHGAGAGMLHPFMESLAADLAALGIATLRYQFPSMERGSRRPDPPALCHATVRAAVAAARALLPSIPLFAGGKSFGGRMTSQAQAENPMSEVRGLVFLGFPLHPPDKPSAARGDHLMQVGIPMLFLQGSRDEFAEAARLNVLVERLGSRATLLWLPNADHSFHVPARSAVSPAQVRQRMLSGLATWIASIGAVTAVPPGQD